MEEKGRGTSSLIWTRDWGKEVPFSIIIILPKLERFEAKMKFHLPPHFPPSFPSYIAIQQCVATLNISGLLT